ncbi:MAG: tetratricopeptide repeat protein [Armatimonadetes bacterium]|nr:tetratricopeptide repeat protein [Armatimonadota bacterium]
MRRTLCLLAVWLAVLALLPAGAAGGTVRSDALREGAALFARGRMAEAEAVFARAVSRHPGSAHGWLWLGVVQFHAGDNERAERSFSRAVRLSPRDGLMLLWWGHALVRTERTAEAGTAFRHALLARSPAQVRDLAHQALRALGPLPHPAAQAPPGQAPVEPPLGAPPSAPPWVLDAASYNAIARFYNPRLTHEQSVAIGQALLGYSRHFNVDPRLVVALVVIESGFQPAARSRAGAIGLGQLMPATARSLGVDAWDPVQNLYGAIRYLRGNLDRFGWSNAHLALAAYNAGRGAVEKHEGIPPYAETQWYVTNISGLYRRLLTIPGESLELSRRL